MFTVIYILCLGGVTSSRGTGKGTNELIIQLLDYARTIDEKNDRQDDKIDLVLKKVNTYFFMSEVI